MGNLWDSAEYMFMSPFFHYILLLSKKYYNQRFRMRLLSVMRKLLAYDLHTWSWLCWYKVDTVLNLFEFCFNYLKHHIWFLSSFPSFWLSINSRQKLNILLKNRTNLKSLFTGVKQFLEKSICSISFSIWSAAAAFCNRSHFKWIECDVLPPLGTILNQGRATQNTFESGISSHRIWVNFFLN